MPNSFINLPFAISASANSMADPRTGIPIASLVLGLRLRTYASVRAHSSSRAHEPAEVLASCCATAAADCVVSKP
jgi:hypothetical protein